MRWVEIGWDFGRDQLRLSKAIAGGSASDLRLSQAKFNAKARRGEGAKRTNLQFAVLPARGNPLVPPS